MSAKAEERRAHQVSGPYPQRHAFFRENRPACKTSNQPPIVVGVDGGLAKPATTVAFIPTYNELDTLMHVPPYYSAEYAEGRRLRQPVPMPNPLPRSRRAPFSFPQQQPPYRKSLEEGGSSTLAHSFQLRAHETLQRETREEEKRWRAEYPGIQRALKALSSVVRVC